MRMGKWVYRGGLPAISTFSIVAVDPATQEIGVAVQSKFLAVGAVVPFASAGIGAVATQAWCNTSFGPRGLDLLERGLGPQVVLEELLQDDRQRASRQVGVVDAAGRAASFTGSDCMEWAGGRTGRGYACQGNILAGPEVVDQMADTFQTSTGALPGRLLAALSAGQAAGGDRRGMQSAALLVVKPGGGYGGYTDRYIDLRVDDHTDPIAEVRRLLTLHHLYFDRTQPADRLPLAGVVLAEVKDLLQALGYAPGTGTPYDSAAKQALKTWMLTENFDERWTEEPTIDAMVLEYLRERTR